MRIASFTVGKADDRARGAPGKCDMRTPFSGNSVSKRATVPSSAGKAAGTLVGLCASFRLHMVAQTS
jgi:hypothetical protein